MKPARSKTAQAPRDLRHAEFLRAIAAMIASAMITGREAAQAKPSELAHPQDNVQPVASQDAAGRGTRPVKKSTTNNNEGAKHHAARSSQIA